MTNKDLGKRNLDFTDLASSEVKMSSITGILTVVIYAIVLLGIGDTLGKCSHYHGVCVNYITVSDVLSNSINSGILNVIILVSVFLYFNVAVNNEFWEDIFFNHSNILIYISIIIILLIYDYMFSDYFEYIQNSTINFFMISIPYFVYFSLLRYGIINLNVGNYILAFSSILFLYAFSNGYIYQKDFMKNNNDYFTTMCTMDGECYSLKQFMFAGGNIILKYKDENIEVINKDRIKFLKKIKRITSTSDSSPPAVPPANPELDHASDHPPSETSSH